MERIIARGRLAMGQPDAEKPGTGETIDPILILTGSCKPDGVAMDGGEGNGLKAKRQQLVNGAVRYMHQGQGHFAPGITHGRDDLVLPIECGVGIK